MEWSYQRLRPGTKAISGKSSNANGSMEIRAIQFCQERMVTNAPALTGVPSIGTPVIGLRANTPEFLSDSADEEVRSNSNSRFNFSYPARSCFVADLNEMTVQSSIFPNDVALLMVI